MLQQMQQQLAMAQMNALTPAAPAINPPGFPAPPPNFKLQAALQAAGPVQSALAPAISPRQSPSQIVPTNPLTRTALDSTGTTQSVHQDSSFEEEKTEKVEEIEETEKEKVDIDTQSKASSKASSVFDEKKDKPDQSVPKPEKEEEEQKERAPSRNSIQSKSPLAKSSPLPTAVPPVVTPAAGLHPALHGLQNPPSGLQGLLGALGAGQPGLNLLQQQILLAQHQVQQQQAQQQQMQQGKSARICSFIKNKIFLKHIRIY